MENLVHLKQDQARFYDEARSILDKADKEKRAATSEEIQKFDELMAKRDALEETIKRMELTVKSPPAPTVSNAVSVHDNAEDKPFRSLGEQLQAVIATGSRRTIDPRLHALETRFAHGMSEAVPADGGFLVQQDFSTALLEKTYAVGSLLARCARLPISGNSNGIKVPGVDETARAAGSRWGGIRGYWVSEAGTITTSQPKYYIVDLTLQKVAAAVYLTDELMQDSSACEAHVRRIVPAELNFMVEDSLVNGNGVGRPLGFMASNALVTVAAETGQITDTIVYENICNMWSRMWGPSRGNAVWLINQNVEPQLYGMGITIGTGGSPVYLPPGGASAAPYGSLFGRPVIPTEYNATLGNLGDICLVDMSQYYVIDKGGIQAAASIHVQFLTDEQVLRFTYRVDGEPSWKGVLAPLNGPTFTLSPWVTLAAR